MFFHIDVLRALLVINIERPVKTTTALPKSFGQTCRRPSGNYSFLLGVSLDSRTSESAPIVSLMRATGLTPWPQHTGPCVFCVYGTPQHPNHIMLIYFNQCQKFGSKLPNLSTTCGSIPEMNSQPKLLTDVMLTYHALDVFGSSPI